MKIDEAHPMKQYLSDREIIAMGRIEKKLYKNGILLVTVVLNIPVEDGRDNSGVTPTEG